MKRAQKGAEKVETLHDLKLLALRTSQPLQLLPPSGTAVAAQAAAAVVVTGSSGKVVHIPMDNALYDTEGLVLTGPVQLRWMQQLLVCLCGIWIRVSCGSTCISMYFNVSRTPHFGYASDTLDTDCIHVSDAGCMGYKHTSWIRTDTQ